MSSKKIKILVVDDDQLVRDMLMEILQSNNYLADKAENGVEAYDKVVSDQEFDLVISDMNMPEKTGLELIKDLRKDKKRILLILLYNIPTWLFESLTLVLLFYLIGFQMNIFIIMLAQIVTFFTKTIPITPGGWGVSEIIGALLLSLFYPAIPYNEILSVFILDHILRMVYVFIYGGISTIAINFRFKDIDTKKFKNSNSL